ncbi:MFS transporter [Nibrella saemangeumensis]|uniref:MFS transporter n=1 Tax=Nibrella saemangeumensis TaxID=1084526 RepID=A0ABP8MPU6_9BACT
MKTATPSKPINQVTRNQTPLPVIVFAQFACTSLWFAGNAVIGDIQRELQLPDTVLGPVTSAVQFGFIVGTMTFALLTIADRFSPSRVFFGCAIAGAVSNLGIYLIANSFSSLLLLRFLTGFFLAGIYPVGMKIAADYHEKGLGLALGYLVGALVLGTAFPHLLRSLTASLAWESAIIVISGLAVLGGLLILLLVPDGPFRRKSSRLDVRAAFAVFRDRTFRSAAFGYFGHMWELYAFWAFVPLLLNTYATHHPEVSLNVPLLSFGVIGMGGPACVLGGYLSSRIGSVRTASVALFISGLCCLLSLFMFALPLWLFLPLVLIWGMAVVADSPQFSALVAQSAPKESVGTALTIVTCVGFSITIVSIQLLNALVPITQPSMLFLVLAGGPMAGLLAMRRR